MSNKPYKIVYSLGYHPKGVLKKDIPEDWGACDDLLLVSIVRTPEGGRSYLIASKDGETGDVLSPKELFGVWAMLTKELSEKSTIRWHRELATTVFALIRAAVAPKKGGNPNAH